MIQFLKTQWEHLLRESNIEADTISKLWQELLSNYSEKHRAYHNLHHLFDLFKKLDRYKKSITDLKAIQFAIWYHDIIYQPLSKTNEEDSAILCSKQLSELGFDSAFKEKVFKLIISTKDHKIEGWEEEIEKVDNAYLLDLDLSILGSEEEAYLKYTQLVRKEYKIVPSFLYRRGRKKVLQHFLAKERIFITEVFYIRYEEICRKNLTKELGNL